MQQFVTFLKRNQKRKLFIAAYTIICIHACTFYIFFDIYKGGCVPVDLCWGTRENVRANRISKVKTYNKLSLNMPLLTSSIHQHDSMSMMVPCHFSHGHFVYMKEKDSKEVTMRSSLDSELFITRCRWMINDDDLCLVFRWDALQNRMRVEGKFVCVFNNNWILKNFKQ